MHRAGASTPSEDLIKRRKAATTPSMASVNSETTQNNASPEKRVYPASFRPRKSRRRKRNKRNCSVNAKIWRTTAAANHGRFHCLEQRTDNQEPIVRANWASTSYLVLRTAMRPCLDLPAKS